MFVRDYIDVAQPFEAVAPRLVQDVGWLDPIAYHALEEAIATFTALHPADAISVRLPPLTVCCARGPVRLRDDSLVMPLRWESNVPATIVGRVDGELEVSPLGDDRSQLALNATAPMSSSAGLVISRRVVEAGVRRFLSEFAATLQGSA